MPPKTSKRIRAYYDYVWLRHRDYAGEDFINSLPSQLRSRVSYIVHAPAIDASPLFSKLHRKVSSSLVNE
eukprot:6151681-Pleurochrysis_carterae.AAC.1